MTRGRHRLAAAVLATLHLAFYTAGEALHWLPGMGHFEEMSCGVCVWNGAPRQHDASDQPVEPEGSWKSQQEDPGQVLTLDDCPICQLTSVVFNQATTVCSVITLPTCGQVYLIAVPSAPSINVVAYGARAPPC